MARIIWFITAVFLVSCNLVSPKNDGKGDSLDQKIVGYWFLCEFSELEGFNCDLVDGDGLAFTKDGEVFRIDGAASYAKTILKDTNSGINFNINAESLYFFAEPESFSGTYSVGYDHVVDAGNQVPKDTLLYIEGDDGTKDTISIENNILITEGPLFRKYEGDAHLVSKEEWMELLNEERLN